MMSGFCLITTLPGREREVVEGLGAMPQIVGRSVLFREAIAVKIECPAEAVEGTVHALAKTPGVLRTQLYRARFA